VTDGAPAVVGWIVTAHVPGDDVSRGPGLTWAAAHDTAEDGGFGTSPSGPLIFQRAQHFSGTDPNLSPNLSKCLRVRPHAATGGSKSVVRTP